MIFASEALFEALNCVSIAIVSGTSELPLFDFSLWDLVRLLGLDNLILLFISVMLEHQVLLYSAGKSFTIFGWVCISQLFISSQLYVQAY